MSTRCMLIVKSRDIWGNDATHEYEALRVYRHCDGYPEGMEMDIAEACKSADEWHDRNNRNWAQPFLAALFASDADMEVCAPDEEHGDIEFLYVVTGIRDVSWGKVGVPSYGLEIAVYQPDWDQTCEEAMKDEPVFTGGWREFMERFGSGAEEVESWCATSLRRNADGTETITLRGNGGIEFLDVDRRIGVDDILLAIEKVSAAK